MTRQLCFPDLEPPAPTIRTERVARRIAERIVAEVNLDDFYWTRDELPERIEDVTREIMRRGKPWTVFERLYRQQPPVGDTGERGTHPYGWDGISEHCRHIAGWIALEEAERALAQYWRDYGRLPQDAVATEPAEPALRGERPAAPGKARRVAHHGGEPC